MMENPIERVTPAKATLIQFVPVEPGWVMTETAPESTPSYPAVNVYPLLGWTLWKVEQGEAEWNELQPMTPWTLDEFREEYSFPEIYFSRSVFREAQSGNLTLSRKALKVRVSENV